MKASDLRIGNYVNYVGLINSRFYKIGEFQIEPHHFGYLFELEDAWDLLEPIPLTEEWLEKFEFDHHYDLGKRKFMNIKTLTIETNSPENFPVYYTTQKIIICYIKYVHQLQNLYFALTGEELILNT